MRIEASQLDCGVREAYAERREQRDQVRVQVRDAQAPPADGTVGGDSESGDPRLMLARLIVEVLLGGKYAQNHSVKQRVEQGPPQWSVTVNHQEVYEESESLVVKARGAVRTADGTEIRFDATFTLARSFRLESGFSLRAGNAAVSDPLFLDTGSGQALVVRDSNGDGEVSHAGELFGARTGDGFAELARLDSDGNGWIDAGDPVFGELRVRLGNGALEALETLGIGALSTFGADGEFHYKNEVNELTAIVRRTGVSLTGNGVAGALRQIDLAL